MEGRVDVNSDSQTPAKQPRIKMAHLSPSDCLLDVLSLEVEGLGIPKAVLKSTLGDFGHDLSARGTSDPRGRSRSVLFLLNTLLESKRKR